MKPRDQIIARMYVVLTLLGVLPVMIVTQILGIDISDGEELRKRGLEQASSLQSIPAVRGVIYDRAGRTLAVNTTRFDLGVDPTVDGYPQKAEALYAKLATVTGRPASSFRAKVQSRSSSMYARLWRNISEADMDEILELDVPGLVKEPTFARRYNYETTLSHVLGFVDRDLNGIAGLEQQYDAYLNGKPGKRIRKINRRGVKTAFVGTDDVKPEHGQSIVLTVDLQKQSIVEEELERGVQEAGATWGIAAAMNPKTGEILSMASFPTFDSNRPGSASTANRRNRVVTDQIEPGSTFKLVSIVAALEEKVASLSDTVDTGDGWAVFGGKTMKDTHANGRISLADAIAVSSNIGIAKTARKMEPGDLYQHARNLGFGQRTYVDLPGEVAGHLKKTSDWSGTSLTSMSIGYEVMVTPLQVLAAYAALANDGLLVQPYIVAERRDFDGKTVWRAKSDSVRRAFKAKTARQLIPAFEEVVETGTATSAQIEGLRIAGKTGTAHKVIDGAYRPSRSRATFVGFFPADDPQVALVVVMDEPETSTYGGVVSAPVFQRIAERWLPTQSNVNDFFDSENGSEEAGKESVVPSVAGLPVAVAQTQMEALGFEVKASGSARAVVEQQTPKAGSLLPQNGRIVLASAQDETIADQAASESPAQTKMPDVEGLGVRQAVYWLASKGITAKLEGRGTIAKQYPAAGEPVGRQATLVAR